MCHETAQGTRTGVIQMQALLKRRIQRPVQGNRQGSKPGKQSRSAIKQCRD